MSRRTLLLVAVLSVATAAIGGSFAANWLNNRRETDKPAEHADLVIDPRHLNLGEVWETDRFEWTLPVTNGEPHPVEIKSFGSTCNCLSIEPYSLTLGPGERRELRLKLDLTMKPPPNGAIRVWLVAYLQEKTSGGKRLGPEWVVSGRTRRAIAVAEQVSLGRHSELAQPLPPTTLAVERLVPLATLSAHSEIPGIEAAVRPSSDSSACLLTLTPTRPLPIGPVEGWVRLSPILPGGETLPDRRVRVSGVIVSDLEAQPPAVQVGGREVGSVVEEVVLLRSVVGRPLAGFVAEPEGEGLTTEATEVPGEFRVRQSVRGTGTRTNQVRFSAEVDGRKVTAVVPVTYTGIPRD